MKLGVFSLTCGILFFSCVTKNRDEFGEVASIEELKPENSCLNGQDLNVVDVDITACPPIPNRPETAFGFSMGSWELGATSLGHFFKYSDLTEKEGQPGVRFLTYYDDSQEGLIYAPVDQVNLNCWAKGYYRLRHYLKTPPAEYMALYSAGYQTRFFQFQEDLRSGQTVFNRITSYQDHLVKWVTLVKPNGTCVQPTLDDFKKYARCELKRRQISFDGPDVECTP